MIVARHEMPGKPHTHDPSRRERCDPGHQAWSARLTYNNTPIDLSHRSLRDGSDFCAAKRLYIIAQGFSPGLCVPRKPP
jgi:hypothetical protein